MRAFAAGAALLTVLSLLLAHGQGRRDLDAHRARDDLRVARALAWVYGESPEAAQPFAEALPRELAGVEEALVLKGAKRAVDARAERAGTALSQESLADKALYDSGQAMKANAKKNLEARDKDPSLDHDPFPEAELGPRHAAAPVKDAERFVAMARVDRAPRPLDAPTPWGVVIAALLAAALFAGVARTKAKLPAGLALLAALAAADVAMLSAWRAQLREATAAEEARTLGGLARAGMLAATPAEHRAELWSALSRDREGRLRAELLLVRSATVGEAALPEARRFESAPYEVWWREAAFAEAAAKDRGDLGAYLALAFLVSAGVFALGATGRAREALRALRANRTAYAYLSPAMLGMGVLVFIPVLYGIGLGFTSASSRDAPLEFAGLSNYLAILSDFDVSSTKSFYYKLGVTVLWTSANVVLHVSIGLFLALLLNDELLKAKGLYRVLLIVPWAIPNYITALIWKGMFHKQFGAVNFALDALGLEPVAWFASFGPAFMANVTTNTWLGFPFMMVVSLGALQSIPTDLYEAAYVDGASRWQRFKDITFPLLLPALVPAVIMGTVWTFNMFNIIYLVSAGAPDGATDILITDAFRWAFERDRYGYAAAYSTLIFLILVAFTLLTRRASKGAVE